MVLVLDVEDAVGGVGVALLVAPHAAVFGGLPVPAVACPAAFFDGFVEGVVPVEFPAVVFGDGAVASACAAVLAVVVVRVYAAAGGKDAGWQGNAAAIRVDAGRGRAFVRVDFAEVPAVVVVTPGVQGDVAELVVLVGDVDVLCACGRGDGGAIGTFVHGRRGDGAVVIADFAGERGFPVRHGRTAIGARDADFVGFDVLGVCVVAGVDAEGGVAFASADGDGLGAVIKVTGVGVFVADADVKGEVAFGGAVQADQVVCAVAFVDGGIARGKEVGFERGGIGTAAQGGRCWRWFRRR